MEQRLFSVGIVSATAIAGSVLISRAYKAFWNDDNNGFEGQTEPVETPTPETKLDWVINWSETGTVQDSLWDKEVARLQQGPDLKTLRGEIRRLSQDLPRINVLCCGGQHNGKSSLLNAIQCALRNTPFEPQCPFTVTGKGSVGTPDLRGPSPPTKLCPLRWYDMPGRTSENRVQDDLVSKVSKLCFEKGVVPKTPKAPIPEGAVQLGDFLVHSEHRIDFCIFVIDVRIILDPEHAAWWKDLKEFHAKLWKEEHQDVRPPHYVFTHCDQVSYNDAAKEQFVSIAGPTYTLFAGYQGDGGGGGEIPNCQYRTRELLQLVRHLLVNARTDRGLPIYLEEDDEGQ